jgi:radical SAM protein with 4Fe4S-binding SPASM domain
MSDNITPKLRFDRLIHNLVFRKRIYEFKLKRNVLPFPSSFCIQTINSCNGSCIMCPVAESKNKKTDVMTNKLFEKIVKEISLDRLRFKFLYLFLQNEPMLDKDIFKKISYIKKISNGKIKTGLVTNGSILTSENIKELENNNLDELIFSIDALKEETYNKIRQGLNYKKIMENINKVIESKYNNYLAVKFVIQKYNISELSDFKKFWEDKNLPVQITTLNNRSGDLHTYNYLLTKKREKSLSFKFKRHFSLKMVKGCSTPLTTFNIMSNGDVILCCNDFSNKLILGNVNNLSIREIWNSEKYQRIREMLFNGEYKKIAGCSDCSKVVI